MSEIPIYQPQEHEIRIIILYMIDKFGVIREKHLNEYVRALDILPYFDYRIQLKELVKINHLSSKSIVYDELLSLNQQGRDALFNLNDTPAKSKMDRIDESVPKYIEIFKAQDELIAEIISPDSENGYSYKVHLAINNNSKPIFTMEFELASYDYAKRFCDNWKKDAGRLFKELTITLNGGEGQ